MKRTTPEDVLLQVLDVVRRTREVGSSALPREGLNSAECELLDYLEPQMPPLLSRSSVPEYIKGIEGKTLANLDSLGQGVQDRFFIGKEVYYKREDVLRFVLSRGIKKDCADPLLRNLHKRKAVQQPPSQRRG